MEMTPIRYLTVETATVNINSSQSLSADTR